MSIFFYFMNNLLIKHKDKESKKLGVEPLKRSISELLEKGIINIDKDCGPSSQQTVTNLKKILNIEKAGHSGTLDPQVSGVLLTGLGKATRLMEYMLKSNKEYVCLMYLHKPIDTKIIKETAKKFTGKIMQLPPVVSAVKRQEREREIYYNDVLEVNKDQKHVLFRIGCQHGTYIRKICTDMAISMGIKGQMKELRRTKAGPITELDHIISLDKLRNLFELYTQTEDEKEKLKYDLELRKYIRPQEEALKDFKKVYVRNSAVNSISHGSDIALPGVSMLEDKIEMGEEVAILTIKGEIIGMGTAFLSSAQAMKKRKGAFVKTNKVLFEPNEYPAIWDFNDDGSLEDENLKKEN